MKLLAPKFQKGNTGRKKILGETVGWAIRLDVEIGTKTSKRFAVIVKCKATTVKWPDLRRVSGLATGR
jgi:hypothetical protein